MSALEWILLVFALILGIGYLVGANANHRRLETIVLQLQRELQPFGTLSKLKPAGKRGVALRLLPKGGRVQFVDFTVRLLAREWLPLWGWGCLHKTCDELLAQANLQPAPNFDICIFPLDDLKSLQALQQAHKPFKMLQDVHGFGIYVRGVGAPSSRDALPAFINNFDKALLHLAIQSPPFNITLRLNLANMPTSSYAILYQALEEVTQ